MKELRLTRAAVSESGDIFRLVDGCRPYLSKWLPWVDATGGAADTFYFINENKDKSLFNGREIYSIYYNGLITGMIDLHNGDSYNKKAEIGYWLAEQFQGKGIITTACKILINKAFYEYNINRMVIRVAVGNIKSQAVPERLGFTHEGIERSGELIRGNFHDLSVYSMIKKEWKSDI
jgi:ribosomal-protein-serine acetyltransferase